VGYQGTVAAECRCDHTASAAGRQPPDQPDDQSVGLL